MSDDQLRDYTAIHVDDERQRPSALVACIVMFTWGFSATALMHLIQPWILGVLALVVFCIMFNIVVELAIRYMVDPQHTHGDWYSQTETQADAIVVFLALALGVASALMWSPGPLW